MPIKGLTDNASRGDRRSNYWGGVLHKGTRKRDGKFYGADLKDLFRFEPLSDVARKTLLDAYPDARLDENRDVILSQLDIFLAYEEIEKSFETWMKKWSTTGLERQCDRSSIVLESQQFIDRYGQPRNRTMPCDKPCPMANDIIGVDCELGCVQEGTLTFYLYLPEQMMKSLYVPHPCYLTVKGYTDVSGVNEMLYKIQDTYGSIKESPIPMGTFGNVIPMILTRHEVGIKRPVLDKSEKVKIAGQDKFKRTDKKTDDTTWAVSLQVNPRWIAACEAARQIKFAIGMGYKPSARLIQQSQIDIALPGALDVKALPQSEFASKEEAIALWQYAVQHGWTKEAIKLCLQSAFQIDSFERIPVDKIDDIKSAIAEPGKANEWLEEVTRNVMAGK